MTTLPFKINGVDFSAAVHETGYETDRRSVYAAQWTDLAGVDHDIELRKRGSLTVQLNDLPESESAALAAALQAVPLSITYYSFQLCQEVTETMRLPGVPRALLLEGDVRWISGTTLQFTQL